jgi:uncharacterized ion transporter superfamily protein YfcC
MESSIKIGKRAFLLAFSILIALVVVSGILTRVIAPGRYDRVEVDGRSMVVEGSFSYYDQPEREALRDQLPVWRWFTAPIEVYWGDNSVLVIVISLFMVFIGGSFTIVEQAGVMEAMLARALSRFENRKYLLMALVMLIIMALASFVGIYEAMTPTVIFMVPLALALGWDSLVGLGMSLLAMGFGFAAAVTNPFTVGVAQKLAELPLYSGSVFRILFFIVVYGIGFSFVALYAKRIERNPGRSLCRQADVVARERYAPEKIAEKRALAGRPEMTRALRWFGSWIGGGVAFLLAAALIEAIPTDAAFPVVAVAFLISGLGAGRRAGLTWGRLWHVFTRGLINIAPGIVLILLAMSVPHIMTRGGVMDTILHAAAEQIRGSGLYQGAFLVYVATLMLNFFVSSASAKAFLMIPILVPLGDFLGLTRQSVIFAFDLGDGFSNIVYPTNALLLVALGFTAVGWTTWIRWSWKVQAIVFLVSMGFLATAVRIGYGPF